MAGKLQQGYEEDEEAKTLITELCVHSENAKGFTLQDGIIRLIGRVWVGNNQLAQ